MGALGKPASLWVECLFVDPIADLAVLGPPDNQELYHEAIEWDEFVGGAGALALGPCAAESRAWLLSLAGAWYETPVNDIYGGPTLLFTNLLRPLEFGMSGSPIIVNGQAAGVVVSDNSSNPYLVQALPVWAIEHLKPPERR